MLTKQQIHHLKQILTQEKNDIEKRLKENNQFDLNKGHAHRIGWRIIKL